MKAPEPAELSALLRGQVCPANCADDAPDCACALAELAAQEIERLRGVILDAVRDLSEAGEPWTPAMLDTVRRRLRDALSPCGPETTKPPTG